MDIICKSDHGFKYSMVLKIYHSGLLLCNVTQGQDGISMDSHGQRCSCSTMYGQDLCDRLNASRMASVTQNLQEQDNVLGLTFSNSLCKKILDGLLVEMRNSDLLFSCRDVQKSLKQHEKTGF